MTRARTLALLAAAALGIGTAPSAAAQGRAPLRTATLADVAFIAGQWEGTLEGGATEEWWTAPAGDNMMGSFRYVKDGKGVFYELLLIEQTPEGPVLRLLHFGPRLVGWEEKGGAYHYPLVELAPGRAVFERPDGQTRLVFHRTGPRAMTVTLEQVKEGRWTSEPFPYTLQP